MFVGIGVGVGRQRFAGGFADSYSARVLADGGTIEALTCVANASTLLQQASLLFIPSGYKAGVAYSALPNNGNGDLTWTRNSTANRTNSSGVISSVGANVPRLSYMYGSCPAALLEPQRTNLALRSNELSTAPNVLDGVTATTNFYNSPDGTTNAIRLAETTANDRHGFFQYYSVTAQTYTISVFAKQIGRRYICLMSDFNGTNTYSFFDLQNKVVVSSGSGYTCTIQEFSDGWLRLSATVTAVSGSRYTIWGGSTNGTTNTYVGSTSTFMSFYGLQLEVGSYPTTYIPTTSASATRLADTAIKSTISSLIGQTEGVIYWEGIVLNQTDIIAINRSTTNGIYITKGSGNLYRASIFNSSNALLFADVGVKTTLTKIAIAYKSGDSALFVNGVKIGATNTSTITFSSSLSELRLNDDYLIGTAPQFTNKIAIFNTRLSDTDCITLTT